MLYVKNKDLRDQLVLSKERNELTKEALDMIILMSNKFSLKFKYQYEDDRKDCVSFAIMDCYKYWRNYNPDKSPNAFSYITQIIKNGFAKSWRQLTNNMARSKRISISSNNIYSI